MNAIEVRNVSKMFRRHTGRKLLREQLRDFLRPRPENLFHALHNVSFSVAPGESVAIVGSNGAGKSTLLSLVAGLARADEGSVSVNGRIAALLELGSGFHPDLTGIENVLLNAALLGFSERQAREALPAIIDFAELGDFIREPIRAYSSGMVVRLAFSVAVHVDPAILIVDEVLGVGDTHFQHKCVERIRTLRREGRTLLCVSHSAAMVLNYCDRAIWLDHGQMVMDDTAPVVMEAYTAYSDNPAAGLPQRMNTAAPVS
jgi:ABC-type polysaccharide/polyol phosphate transport system ATPase subunit